MSKFKQATGVAINVAGLVVMLSHVALWRAG